MPKYLDPKADVVFKKIFANHPHLLISFLNAVLPLPPDRPIVSLEYLPAEQIPEIPAFKRTIADVKCKDSSGRVFIVEMQIDWTDGFKQRLLFGTSQAIVKQLHRGQMYQLLQPVYGLGIIADVWNEEDPEWYHHYRLIKNGEKKEDVIEHLQLIFIELPKFKPHSREEKHLRLLWLRFLREIDEKTTVVPPELLNVPEIHEAIELSRESAYTFPELSAYEVYWDSVRTERTLLQGRYDEGKAEGRAEGKAEGRVEGKAEGIFEAKIAMARELKKQGIPLATIKHVTALSQKELEEL
jgi:predicted transposase/invertase (TIGR01784 family)